MGVLYLMSGPSAAGKTTYAKEFIKYHSGIRYLCIDDFYAVYGGTVDSHDHEFEVWQSFFQAINLAMEDQVDVLVDTNAPTVVMRTQFLDWFGKFDRYVLMFINSTLEDCQIRNANRDRTVPPHALKKMYYQVEHPTITEDARWSVIKCFRHVGDRFEPYPTPIGGPGTLQLTDDLTKMLDRYLMSINMHTEIFVPATYARIHAKHDTVKIPIVVVNEGVDETSVSRMHPCALMDLNLMTGTVEGISLTGIGMPGLTDSVFRYAVWHLVENVDRIQISHAAYSIIRALLVEGQCIDVPSMLNARDA